MHFKSLSLVILLILLSGCVNKIEYIADVNNDLKVDESVIIVTFEEGKNLDFNHELFTLAKSQGYRVTEIKEGSVILKNTSEDQDILPTNIPVEGVKDIGDGFQYTVNMNEYLAEGNNSFELITIMNFEKPIVNSNADRAENNGQTLIWEEIISDKHDQVEFEVETSVFVWWYVGIGGIFLLLVFILSKKRQKSTGT